MSRVWIIFILLLAVEILILGYLLLSMRSVHKKAPADTRHGSFREAATNHELYFALLRGRKQEFTRLLAPVDDATFVDLRRMALIFAAILIFDVIYDFIHAIYGI